MKFLCSILIILTAIIKSSSAVCTPLSPPIGGFFISGCGTNTGSVCSVQCQSSGIILSQVCQANGAWSGQPFYCANNYGNVNSYGVNQISCPYLTPPINGAFIGNCQPGIVGGTCTFTCRAGSIIQGAATLTCLASGAWSTSVPTCRAANQVQWYLLVRRWFG